jgi:hypothetical protein
MPFPLVKFKQWTCDVMLLRYQNGRPALQLMDAATGEPIAKATVNLPDEYLPPNEVFIKNYGENEGILQSLIDAKIVAPAHRIVATGHSHVGQCRLIHEVE